MRRRPSTTIEQAFLDRVFKRDNGCWEWTGSKNGSGYGQITYKGKHYAAHRLAYELFKGPLIERDVAHTCDYRWCVNPDHLFNASRSENMRDCITKGRMSQLIYDQMQARAAKGLLPWRERKRLSREAAARGRNRERQFGRFASPNKQYAPRQRDWLGRFIQ